MLPRLMAATVPFSPLAIRARHALGAAGNRLGSCLRCARRHRARQRDRVIVDLDVDIAVFEQRLVEELRLQLGRNPTVGDRLADPRRDRRGSRGITFETYGRKIPEA